MCPTFPNEICNKNWTEITNANSCTSAWNSSFVGLKAFCDMKIHLTLRVVTDSNGRRISILNCGCMWVRSAWKIAFKKIPDLHPSISHESLWSGCGMGVDTNMSMIRVYTTRELDTSNTPCKRRIGNKRLKFLSLIATSRQALSDEFHLHIMSGACRDDAYQMLPRSKWNVIAMRKLHLIHFPVTNAGWELKTNKAKIAESQTFKSKNPCLPFLVCTRQICENIPNIPLRRSNFERHYPHSFTTVLFQLKSSS